MTEPRFFEHEGEVFVGVPLGLARAVALLLDHELSRRLDRGQEVDQRVVRLVPLLRQAARASDHEVRTRTHRRTRPGSSDRGVLTTSAAAAVLGVTERQVRRLAARGRIEGHRDGRDWWFSEEAIERWREQRRSRRAA